MVISTASRKIISIILCNILVIGTITAFFPSISMAQVKDLSENSEKMMNYDDNNNYKSAKYSSFKKDNIDCNNVNLNLNGLDVNAIPEPLSSLLQPQTETTEEGADNDARTIGNGAGRDDGYQDKDFSFTCVNNNDNEFILPSSQVPVKNVCTVWEEETNTSPFHSDIFFSGSRDDGETFSIPLNISKNIGESTNQQIKCDGNNVYVVWQNATGEATSNIFFARSTDGGQTFSEPDNLSDNAVDSVNSREPQISSQGNNIYVVWEGATFGGPNIFFARSTDGGQTFSDPNNLSNTTGGAFSPQISSDGNNVYVVWRTSDIFFSFSHDGGQTFSTPPDNLSEEITGEKTNPQISSEGDNVYVVWDNPGAIDIFFARSTDGGQTFSTPPENISDNAGLSFIPQISSEGDNVYVVWADDTDGNLSIFFARSTNVGQTFSTPENISDNAGLSFNQQISVEGNNVYVVWEDDTDDSDIFFSFSTDGGQTFSDPDNISENQGLSNLPQISSDGNNVYVVWEDDSDSTSGFFDIFFSFSHDGGQTFSTPPDNLSKNTGNSISPQISSTTS